MLNTCYCNFYESKRLLGNLFMLPPNTWSSDWVVEQQFKCSVDFGFDLPIMFLSYVPTRTVCMLPHDFYASLLKYLLCGELCGRIYDNMFRTSHINSKWTTDQGNFWYSDTTFLKVEEIQVCMQKVPKIYKVSLVPTMPTGGAQHPFRYPIGSLKFSLLARLSLGWRQGFSGRGCDNRSYPCVWLTLHPVRNGFRDVGFE